MEQLFLLKIFVYLPVKIAISAKISELAIKENDVFHK
jgi:hypothetical protein